MQEQSILGRLLMKITDVRIRKITDDEKMKAVVSITIDNEFVVHDIKIINGSNGEFIAMPNKRLGNGDFRDIAHPLTAKTREKFATQFLKNITGCWRNRNRIIDSKNPSCRKMKNNFITENKKRRVLPALKS